MTSQSRLYKKHGVPLLRCSTNEQTDTSIPDQLATIERFAKEHGMLLRQPEVLAGKSGSIRQNLEDAINHITNRKQAGELIHFVMVHDLSRFGRSGPLHFGHLMCKLEDAGVELIEVDSYIEDPDLASTIRVIKSDMVHRQAKGLALASTRGLSSSLQQGRRAHCPFAAYGIDRLYLDSNGSPLYIIRQLEDGTRLKLDPDTYAEKERYLKGSPFKKEKMHRVELIPGADSSHRIVIRIYAMHFEQKFGAHRIAKLLNDEGHPSPRGKMWSTAQVNSILNNSVYCGVGLASFHSQHIYYMQSLDGPVESEGPKGVRKTLIRPKEDWIESPEPALIDYLPSHLRDLAAQRHAAYQERNRDGHTRSHERSTWANRHDKSNGRSSGLLSGILKEASSGRPMKLTSQKNREYLYYRVKGKSTTPSSNAPRDVPAGPLDRAVLGEIERLLCNTDDLHTLISSEIRRQQADREDGLVEVGQLRGQLARAQKRHARLLHELGGPDDESVETELACTKDAIRSLKDRLADLGGSMLTDEQISELSASVITDLSSRLEQLGDQRNPGLRTLAELLVDEAVVDTETRQASIRFAVPPSLIHSHELGLLERYGSVSFQQTNNWNPLSLSTIDVSWPKRCDRHCHRPFKRRGCTACRRRQQRPGGSSRRAA